MVVRGGIGILLIAAAVHAGGVFAQSRDRTLTIAPAGKPPEARYALVIGNSNYANGPLRNPVNDARAMAKALGAAGFSVRVVEDATFIGMQRAVRLWGDDIAKGGVGLFYYAGHGLQVKGKNFLVPVNADIEREDEIEFSTLDVNVVLAKMDAAKNPLNIVILDACRDNPFARSFRSMGRGLAQMDAPTGTFIAYATAPGSTANDGAGANGLYTEHLLKEMQRPGVPIEQMFKQVRNGVMGVSKGQQIPWEASSMRGDFSFVAGAPVAAVAAAPSQPAVSDAVADALRREREAQSAAMERMIAAALEKQRALLEAQGLKLQASAAPPPPKPAAPDPREAEFKAAAAKAAAERAQAEKMLAEAKLASERAAAEKLAAQKAAADLATAERAAGERVALAKAASEKAAAEQAAAKLASERAAAERLAAQKAAAELNATADRVTAERNAAEKERNERVQVATAAPVSIASTSGSRLPQRGDTWTYRLTEPNRTTGPKQRNYVVTVDAASESGILDRFVIEGERSAQWVHGPEGSLSSMGVSIFAPYMASFQDLRPKESLPRIAINEPACAKQYLCSVTGEVVGRENIKVAGGSFTAVKVSIEHSWRPRATGVAYDQARMVGGRELLVWYVPELKRAVKYRSRLNVGEWPPVEADFDLELVSYQLK
jgi:uncharacterized caspase-like protein